MSKDLLTAYAIRKKTHRRGAKPQTPVQEAPKAPIAAPTEAKAAEPLPKPPVKRPAKEPIKRPSLRSGQGFKVRYSDDDEPIIRKAEGGSVEEPSVLPEQQEAALKENYEEDLSSVVQPEDSNEISADLHEKPLKSPMLKRILGRR